MYLTSLDIYIYTYNHMLSHTINTACPWSQRHTCAIFQLHTVPCLQGNLATDAHTDTEIADMGPIT